MKYAYINGKILDGTKDMQVKEGFVILTDNDKIEDIVKAGTDLNGYEKVDLKGRYIMPGLINMLTLQVMASRRKNSVIMRNW